MRFAAFPAIDLPKEVLHEVQYFLESAGHFPRRASHPSKNSTRLQPFHIAVAVAPLPLPPFRLGISFRFRCRFRVSMLRRRETRLRGFPPLSGP